MRRCVDSRVSQGGDTRYSLLHAQDGGEENVRGIGDTVENRAPGGARGRFQICCPRVTVIGARRRLLVVCISNYALAYIQGVSKTWPLRNSHNPIPNTIALTLFKFCFIQTLNHQSTSMFVPTTPRRLRANKTAGMRIQEYDIRKTRNDSSAQPLAQ